MFHNLDQQTLASESSRAMGLNNLLLVSLSCFWSAFLPTAMLFASHDLRAIAILKIIILYFIYVVHLRYQLSLKVLTKQPIAAEVQKIRLSDYPANALTLYIDPYVILSCLSLMKALSPIYLRVNELLSNRIRLNYVSQAQQRVHEAEISSTTL